MAHSKIGQGALVTFSLAIATGVFSLTGCDDPVKDTKYEDVNIKGTQFHLELALDQDVRFKGLSGRESIPTDGGMLFVFPQPITSSFVMRDCPIPIDIIFLDGTGRVLASYKMTAEAPRTEDEKKNDARGVNDHYENRLKKYSSKFATQFVIELKGNTLDTLKVKDNDKINLDLVGLKKRAK